MPISGGKYVAPTWVDNAPPALGATELQAISDSVASYADPVAQIPWFTRPNLLDNWYFVGGGSQQGGGQFPINSRGATSSYKSSGGNAYFIDKWLHRNMNNTTLSVQENGFKFTVMTASGSNKYQFINQRFGNHSDLLGKTVTISVLIAEASFSTGYGVSFAVYASDGVGLNTSNLGSIGYTTAPGLYSATFTLPSTITKTGLTIGFYVADGSSIGDYCVISAAKLELGATQTLAHQENGSWVLNEVPNFDEQFMRCALLPGVPFRYEAGTYIGTGQKGSSNPNSLTFSFVPKVVYIVPGFETTISTNDLYMWINDSPVLINTHKYENAQYASATYSVATLSRTTLSWYCNNTYSDPGVISQANKADQTYCYFAIG